MQQVQKASRHVLFSACVSRHLCGFFLRTFSSLQEIDMANVGFLEPLFLQETDKWLSTVK